MAAREGGLSSRCISLLEEVKVLLENKNDGGSSPSNASIPNISEEASVSSNSSDTRRVGDQACTSRSSTPSNSLIPVSTQRQERVTENFRSLFSPYGPSARSSWLRPPPGKKPKKGPFQVKETWTHKFFCLASTDEMRVPSRKEKIKLQNAGLGRKKVVFSCKASALEVQRVLEGIYPKLKTTGGFELLRSGSPSSSLVLIRPSAAGYSVPFLRDSAGLGQALVYIRPLQKSLEITSVDVEDTEEEVCIRKCS